MGEGEDEGENLSVNQIWYFKIKAWCEYPSILTLTPPPGRGKKENRFTE